MAAHVNNKRDEWIARIGLLGLAIFFGFFFIFAEIHANWIEFWLTKDAVRSIALVTGGLSHGAVDYKYSVGPKTYAGRSQLNWQEEKYRNVGVGEESVVFYSSSHPWFSSLETPQFPRSDSIVLLIEIPIEFLLIATAINPGSRWALSIRRQSKARGPD